MTNAVIRKEPDGFVIVANRILNDPDLSMAAKGMYAYMKSKPDNWNFTIRSMASQLKEGQTAISSAVKELRSCGLVTYQKQTDGTGIYFVHSSITKEEPKPDNPDQAFPTLGKPKRISKTDLSSNKEVIKDMCAQHFELFWSAGMRKLNKKGALKAFQSACKRLKADPQEFAQRLADDVAARIASGQLGFDAMHPTTYLNNERWEDEVVKQAEKAAFNTDSDRWWTSDAGIQRKAAQEGIYSRPGESYRDLADRIRVMESKGVLRSQQPKAEPVEDLLRDQDIPF